MGRFRTTCTPTSEHAGLYNHTASWPFQNFRWLGLAHLTSLTGSLSVAWGGWWQAGRDSVFHLGAAWPRWGQCNAARSSCDCSQDIWTVCDCSQDIWTLDFSLERHQRRDINMGWLL